MRRALTSLIVTSALTVAACGARPEVLQTSATVPYAHHGAAVTARLHAPSTSPARSRCRHGETSRATHANTAAPHRCLTRRQQAALHAWLVGVAFARWLTGLQTIPPDLVAVADCVKAHESGNYAEASHPSEGSGAFQYVPSTWRYWSARWAAATSYTGPTYAYAYEAPPDVQDRVFVYTLRNGGAHNWSPLYGNDPCTAGMT